MKERLEVLFSGNDLDEIMKEASEFVSHKTFKVTCLNSIALDTTAKLHHPERRSIERKIGEAIQGEADLLEPEVNFGFVLLEGCMAFRYSSSERADMAIPYAKAPYVFHGP